MRWIVSALVAGLLIVATGRPASAQPLDPAVRADIEQLLAVTGSSSMGTQMASLMSDQMLQVMRREQPDIPPRVLSLVQEVFTEEFTRAFGTGGGIAESLVQIYAKHFSPDDVRGLLAFYNTELGRRSIQVMPTVMREGALAGQAWAEKETPRILSVLQSRLRAEKLIP